ncbi:hypothetical protein HZS_7986 [Henneguya salminicola]|nr:hypothetical protein HZS_7986 [Henneguya salminicola]
MEYAWMPMMITVDFEYYLISSVKHEFTESKILGCYFHSYKPHIQGCPSNIELLAVLKISEVIDGINYIKSLLIEDESVEAFWNYFAKIRRKRLPPSLRNINAYGVYHLAGRTNNCLERYNRRIGDFLINAHPNLGAFISNSIFTLRNTKVARENASGIVYNQERFKKPSKPNDYIECKSNQIL